MSHPVRRWPPILAFLCLLPAGLPSFSSPVRAQPVDGVRFAAVLEAARAYADDRTLIFYCLRRDSDRRPFLYYLIQSDLDEALQKLKAAGGDLRQTSLLVEAVWANIRTSPPDAQDATLQARCATTDIVEEIETLKGVGLPLFLRPAFRALARH